MTDRQLEQHAPATDAESIHDEDPAEQWEWLHVILDLPKIGGILCFCLAVAPFAIVMIVYTSLFLGSVDAPVSDEEASVAMLLALVPTWWWLRVLERKAGVGLCLPIPVINIPIKWVLAPFGLLLLLGVVGLI